MHLEKINPDTLPDAAAMGYTQVTTTEASKLVFISGQVAMKRDGGEIPEDLASQVEIAMDNLRLALEAVGAGPEHVTSLRMYIVNLSSSMLGDGLAHVNAFFGGPMPSATVVGVTSLVLPQLKVEIEATAAL